MRISDWSSDVCSSDLRFAIGPVVGAEERPELGPFGHARDQHAHRHAALLQCLRHRVELRDGPGDRFIVFPRREALIGGKGDQGFTRSEEHTSALQSLIRISYAVFRLKKKTSNIHDTLTHYTPYPIPTSNPTYTQPHIT